MAKKENRRSSNRWEDTLPSVYATIPVGFHAKMTVEEMVNFLDMGKYINIPQEMRHIKLFSFTPDMFAHPRFKDFWEKPVSTYHLKDGGKRELVFNALNDPDVRKVQKEAASYNMDVVHPNLETLARLAQTQFLGFRLRLSELSSASMLSRLEKLKDPEEYKKIRVIADERLGVALPAKAPEFLLGKRETCVKRIGSALGKAYNRTGKPKDIEAFLKDPNAYGINGVNDMLRATIKFTGEKGKNVDNFTAVRNLLSVASLSGEMGFLPTEMTDQVLYSKKNPERSSEKVPVVMFKGLAAHTGAEGSVVTLPVELQIQFLSDGISAASHVEYSKSRHPDTSAEERLECEMKRDLMFAASKSQEMHAITEAYHQTGKMDAGWEKITTAFKQFTMKFNGSSLTQGCPGYVRDAVKKCVHDEFPEEYRDTASMVDLNLDNLKHPVVQKSLALMIKREQDVTDQYLENGRTLDEDDLKKIKYVPEYYQRIRPVAV